MSIPSLLCSPAEIAANIRTRCDALGVSLAAMQRALSMGRNTVHNMAARGSYPQVDTLARIAEYLGCTVNDLIYRE